MKKNLKYYLNIDYPIEIQKIKEEEGGGFMATIPQLGKYAFVGDGDTIEEAIKSLNEIKEYLFKEYLEKGIPIPEPQSEEEKEYSGKFLLRVPKELHRFLAIEAKRNSTTLNQYCIYLLTRKSFLKGIQDDLEEVRSEIKNIFTWLRKIDYKVEKSESTFAYSKMNLSEYNKSA
ncbi:MAG: toxin-antitoxin system HicB family antitoxin [Calditrichaeota bacterium]|nr:toxin-antitoxin system HicB family antitoxin [Calditrichota bacterium]